MKVALAAGVLAVLVAVSGGLDNRQRVEIGDNVYLVPREFGRVSSDKGIMGLQFDRHDWTALKRDVTGWDDNVNVLIYSMMTEHGRRHTIPEFYDTQYDGTPVGITTGWSRIERIYRIEPGMEVRAMGSQEDVVIPDQDMATMPEGFMVCGRPKPYLMNAACTAYFEHDGARWHMTFGRQFMGDYAAIRARATAAVDAFKERGEHGPEMTVWTAGPGMTRC